METKLRVLVGSVAVLGALAACSAGAGDSSRSSIDQLPTIDIAKPDAKITVGGQPIPGLDQSTVGCMRGSGMIASTGLSGTAAGQSSVSLLIADTDPPVLDGFYFVFEGVQYAAGVETGKGAANVTVAGDRFTATGDAQGTTPENVVLTKSFEIALTCSKAAK